MSKIIMKSSDGKSKKVDLKFKGEDLHNLVALLNERCQNVDRFVGDTDFSENDTITKYSVEPLND